LHNNCKGLQGFECVCGIGESFDFHDVFTFGNVDGLLDANATAGNVSIKCNSPCIPSLKSNAHNLFFVHDVSFED
jgi:hypothetical protein